MASKAFAIGGHRFPANDLAPGLYVVATPIGNLADITVRALHTLAAADLILCEDTRTSSRLLDHYAISTPRRALHEHNETAAAGAIVAEIETGRSLALISDAGTPLLSDPGFVLVRLARDRGIDVWAVPGASALLAGLAAAGLPTDAFGFFGFLPPRSPARRKALAALAGRPETLVFYESPRRLAASLGDLAAVLGDHRPAVVARELTKKFETVYRGTLTELAERFSGASVKGEVVVVVGGARHAPDPGAWRSALAAALVDRPLKSAVTEIAAGFGVSRREVYQAALAIRNPHR